MSLVAFTFGSLGDIIALLQLADQVRKTLCDTRGASAEYRDLIAELDSVVYTITNVQRVLSIQGPCRLAQSVENALYHAVSVCLHLVAQMNERISTRRQAACGHGIVRMMVADVWQSIGWTLFKREEVLFLRERLSGQVAAMNTLLMLTQSDQLDHVGDQVSRFHGEYLDESRRQYTLIQEIHRCVMNRPRVMGYTWEAAQNPDNMPIVFTDILGHTVTLPWEFVETHELFHELLLFYFRNSPCLVIVRQHNYFLVDARGYTDLLNVSDSGGWQSVGLSPKRLRSCRIYKPGSKIDMHGEVRMKFPASHPRPRHSAGNFAVASISIDLPKLLLGFSVQAVSCETYSSDEYYLSPWQHDFELHALRYILPKDPWDGIRFWLNLSYLVQKRILEECSPAISFAPAGSKGGAFRAGYRSGSAVLDIISQRTSHLIEVLGIPPADFTASFRKEARFLESRITSEALEVLVRSKE